MTTIGYARVSTDEQHLDLQLTALRAAHCERIFEDSGVSAIAKIRPGFEAALDHLNPGDALIIWKMDRAFRSLRQALDLMDYFAKRQIAFRSLTDHIDTSTPMGEAMYQIQNVFAELERKLISERTKAGLKEARRRGQRLGRPPLLTPKQIVSMRELLRDPNRNLEEIARRNGVCARTLKRALESKLP